MRNRVQGFKGSSGQETTLKPLNSETLEPIKEGWKWVRLGDFRFGDFRSGDLEAIKWIKMN